MGSQRILVTGSAGQVGRSLTPALRARYGAENVVAAANRTMPPEDFRNAGPFVAVDVNNREALADTIDRHRVSTIYHLAAVLSADGETNPERAWRVNVESLRIILDLAVERSMRQVFWPSSIAVFGPTTPRRHTPQHTILEPTTMYGVNKLVGENLCHYYFRRHGLDVRSLRYPGLITYKTFSGGGTTDYSVEMFLAAKRQEQYICFVRSDTMLPLMYIDDAVRATVEVMTADPERISVRTSYNLAALSFTAAELAGEITRRVPSFSCDYIPDSRQAIADSWPASIDDSPARRDWGWAPAFDLPTLAEAMLRGVETTGAAAEGRTS